NLYTKMSKNDQPTTSGTRTSSLSMQRASKRLRLDDPSFEDVFQRLLLESDQCDSDGDVDDCLFYEADIQENHSSEQEIIEESGSTTRADGDVRRSDSESSDDDNIPIAQLRPSKYNYGKNRYKWATEPPSRRVRTPQHNIALNRSILHLTEDEKKDPISIWNKLLIMKCDKPF
ncbi:hypothetical protein HHI36_019342, partial [Cryptolaemus montrouzieri]